MAFSDYTTSDNVRAVIGISAKEVSNAVVENNVYLTGMLEALRALSPNLAADYLAAVAITGRTAAQNRFVLLAETFCSYSVAVQLIPSLPLAAPQIITDGKSAQNRIANPYEQLLPTLNAALSNFATNLMGAYSDINSAIPRVVATPRRMVSAVGLAVDPVTG